MAILTTTTLKQYADTERIDQLISRMDAGVGQQLPDASIATSAIAAADGRIKGMLSKLYTSAEIEADESMKSLCAIFTMHQLELTRSDSSKAIQIAYEEGLVYLRQLVLGEVKLAAVAQSVPICNRSEAYEDPQSDTFANSDLFDGLD